MPQRSVQHSKEHRKDLRSSHLPSAVGCLQTFRLFLCASKICVARNISIALGGACFMPTTANRFSWSRRNLRADPGSVPRTTILNELRDGTFFSSQEPFPSLGCEGGFQLSWLSHTEWLSFSASVPAFPRCSIKQSFDLTI